MSEMTVVTIPVSMGPMLVNAYLLVGEKKVVVVDTGVADQLDRLLAAIDTAGRRPADVSLIVLTHGHGDHAGSADALRAATGAPVAVGAGDQEKMRLGYDAEMQGRGVAGRSMLALIRRRSQSSGTRADGPVADIVISEETSLAPYGVDAVVVPTAGHSTGSLTVFTDSGDALVGDLIGGGGRSHGAPKPGVFYNDDDAMSESIAAVIAREPRLVYTGHDAHPFTLEQMREAFPGPA